MLTCPNCGRESPEDFAFCPACSTPLTSVAAAREVRKTVSIVFCDVTGSTALGELLDPETLRRVMARYFDTMKMAIERHGGTVEKYIGDAVMAVFGIPILHEDDALRAARAAADMREALAALNKELERDRGVAIQVRIGLNTGEVVAGDPGGGNAFVTGDAVNVAARLEQHAEPGQVLLGEATYRLVRDAVVAERVEPLELKGKAERVPAWSLVGVREVTSAVTRRLDSPMVGRERPLAQLRQAFDAAEGDDACQLFTLLGSAGVGKSRLVEEFLSTVGGPAEVLRGRCLPYGEGITYFPVVEAIKQAAGLADFDLPDVVESKVCSVLDEDEHQELVCRHVSQLMGAAEAAASEDTFWAIRRFFEASARERPLVLVFDDIHWGEPTFLDLVEHIADWSRGSSILLLCMARSDLLDVRPTWAGGKLNATTVSLEPLADDQSADLIANLLGTAELPAGIADRIVQTAEGNPLFVEEMLAMLIDDGLIVRHDGRWTAAGDLSSVAVPPSIHALLDSRLDRLTPEERQVLEAAAVIGKEFFVGAVRDLVPQDRRAGVPSDLLSLVRKELIRSEPTTLPGEDAFRFRHLLVRDSAYEALPKAQRAEMHERFAAWLERVAGAAVAEQEEILAYHLEQAYAYRLQLGPADERSDAIGGRAAERLASAGRRASARGDHRAAASLLRRALDLASSGGVQRARLLYELGESTVWVGDTNEAFAAYDEAVGLAADAGDRSLEWLARIRRSATQMLTDPHAKPTEQLRAELEEARHAFEELEDDSALATVWTELALIEWMPCRYHRATLAADRAVEHARRSGDERLLAEALVPLIAGQMFGLATPDEGLRTLDGLSGDLSDSRLHESLMLSVRASFTAMQGYLEEARRLMTLAVEIAESLGSGSLLAGQSEQLGHIEFGGGDAEAAERAFRSYYESLEGLGDEAHGSTGAAMLARALCELGRFDEAERYAEMALRLGAEDDLATQVPARSTQALVHAARGEFAEAEQLAREAVELFADAEAPNSQGDAWLDLAQVLRVAGKPVEATRAAGEALGYYERKQNRLAAGTARALIDGLASGG